MSFTYRFIPSDKQNTSVWPGGTTTELAIFPPGTSYGARNFQWRISTAVVTADESTFTSLPGWHRLLMVLSGQMRLSHSGHHTITLCPFDQDSFSGSWVTHCTGTGRDFNLMLAGGWLGSLEAVRLPGGESITMELVHKDAHEAFYCLAGRALLSLPGGIKLLAGAGDFLLLQQEQCEERQIEVSAQAGPVELIRARIWRE